MNWFSVVNVEDQDGSKDTSCHAWMWDSSEYEDVIKGNVEALGMD